MARIGSVADTSGNGAPHDSILQESVEQAIPVVQQQPTIRAKKVEDIMSEIDDLLFRMGMARRKQLNDLQDLSDKQLANVVKQNVNTYRSWSTYFCNAASLTTHGVVIVFLVTGASKSTNKAATQVSSLLDLVKNWNDTNQTADRTDIQALQERLQANLQQTRSSSQMEQSQELEQDKARANRKQSEDQVRAQMAR